MPVLLRVEGRDAHGRGGLVDDVGLLLGGAGVAGGEGHRLAKNVEDVAVRRGILDGGAGQTATALRWMSEKVTP
jgi:hypothetical protein